MWCSTASRKTAPLASETRLADCSPRTDDPLRTQFPLRPFRRQLSRNPTVQERHVENQGGGNAGLPSPREEIGIQERSYIMGARQQRYGKEEFARRGLHICER